MSLRFYNTLTRKKEDFVPLDANNVRMYVCGPTVYDYAHIGNARPVIVFDVLFRLLRHIYGENHVTYVRNITDVDDKINARAQEIAKERGIPVMDAIRELTTQTAKQYEEDVTALGCLKPTHEPRATEHIEQMIALIQRLISTGHAYFEQGHVLFDVSSKADYGKLSRESVDKMIEGARIEVAPYKKNPMDFVLWKPSTPELPGWNSPWGRGRPGWHIECSAMSEVYLGDTFDIHGGGIDLLFPHHENEIAQSEGAHNYQLARVWMHNGFLQVEGEKMSKSLGNFVTIRQILENWNGTGWPGEAIRFNMLRSHYRHPFDWTVRGLDEAHKILWDWYGRFENKTLEGGDLPSNVQEALSDDLNTPQAITEMHTLNSDSELFSSLKFLGLSGKRQNLRRNTTITIGPAHLSITGQSADVAIRARKELAEKTFRAGLAGSEGVSPLYAEPTKEYIEECIRTRNAARKAKNFKESDRIRDELESKGIILKDNPDGTTTWEVKR